MKNPFATEATARHLKIAVTGKTNAGKTVFGLLAKKHGLGPVYVLSLEAGDVHHWHHPEWGGFGRLTSSSLADINEGIDYLYANPGGTLVVDTETGIYETLTGAVAKADGSINVKSWGLIKRTWRTLMARLNNLPMNIVHVVHENDIMEETKVVGQKLDVEKSFERNPDIILRLGYSGETRMGRVLKDRTGLFASGATITEPHIGMWAKMIKAGAAEERIATPEEVDERNATSMATGGGTGAVEPASSSLAAMLKIVEEHEPFGAEAHANNWWKKHRAEIEPLTKAEQGALWRAVQLKTKGGNGAGKESAQ